MKGNVVRIDAYVVPTSYVYVHVYGDFRVIIVLLNLQEDMLCKRSAFREFRAFRVASISGSWHLG